MPSTGKWHYKNTVWKKRDRIRLYTVCISSDDWNWGDVMYFIGCCNVTVVVSG